MGLTEIKIAFKLHEYLSRPVGDTFVVFQVLCIIGLSNMNVQLRS